MDSDSRPLDLRLVPAAAACWGATLVGLHAGWVAAGVLSVVLGVVAAALGLALAVARRRGGAGNMPASGIAAGLIAAALIGAGFGAAIAVRAHAVASHPLADRVQSGGTATLDVALDDDPKVLRSSGFGGQRQLMIRASLRSVRDGVSVIRTGGAVLIFAQGADWEVLLPGQQVTLRGRLAPPDRSDLTVAVVRATGPPTRVEEPPRVQRWAGAIRDRFAAATAAALPPEQAGLLPGLVVGDTSALPQQVKDEFTAAGLAHLTAVSGANISIVLGAVLLAVRGIGVGPRMGALLAALALAAFVVVARPSPSVLRAAAMGCVALLALVTGRRKQAIPALASAVVLLLALFPSLAVDFGFALSVVATAGLVLLAPIAVHRLRERGWPRWLAEMCAVAVAAFVVTAPVVAAMSGAVSLVSIVANILVAPVVAPLTVIGAVTALFAAVWLPAATLLVRVAGPPLWWLLEVADRAASFPGATFAVAPGLVGALVVAAVLLVGGVGLRYQWSRRMMLALGVGVAVVWVPTRLHPPGWPAAGWSVVVCDVGQGDGLVLATGDGRGVVVDAGPDPRLMDACLDRLGIEEIPLMIVTHLHADHYGGLDGVLGDRTVGAIAIGPARLPAGGFRFVSAAASRTGVALVRLEPGREMRVGTLRLRVLGPLLPVPRDPADADDSANDQSLVMMADTPTGTVLLTGDVEESGQRALLRSGIPLRADVLKLPHHGSRTTATEFLAEVRPRVALVSVGAGNSFGHPHAGIVRQLDALGAVTMRTDRHGDVALVRSGSGALAVVGRSHGTIVR
ncbi:DNA internalization-related competence protein ComEC/Rec2 [Rhodococcus sp. ABRD24]|uniref:DNA internalization-related competence protein ComEC/Rec2 n=1 Tax=Rhodococcus sp. ABRD24 TaxID=2507582 RepID=UPI00103C6DC1|nr:DNA internalization-related competence protein ComEC/Rec2 [Rhodococcus sp. ABRD24]QBJ95034.1 DNA internalization-related competence protein ComEC/Rec2 [Rhodococcus sp. ABRD24]